MILNFKNAIALVHFLHEPPSLRLPAANLVLMFSTAITDPTSLPHEIRTQRPEGPAGFAEVLGDVITENTGGRASERNKPDL